MWNDGFGGIRGDIVDLDFVEVGGAMRELSLFEKALWLLIVVFVGAAVLRLDDESLP